MSKLDVIRQLIPPKVSLFAGRQILQIQKNSPTLLFGAGIAGFITTTVMASRATLKADDILKTASDDLEKVEEVKSNAALCEEHGYTDDDAVKDRFYIYSRLAVDLGKLYGPTIVVGVLSIVALTKSHRILSSRNNALMAAYAGLDRSYRAYREKIREEFGEDRERELYLDAREQTVAVRDEETGDAKVLPTGFRIIGGRAVSPYARFFDETATEWVPDSEYNWLFLRNQQSYMNDMLRSRGHVFLNEVYDRLGMNRSREGAIVGWVISKDGDNYVDFGFFDQDHRATRDFVNGNERSVLLDFNVNGVIYDLI